MYQGELNFGEVVDTRTHTGPPPAVEAEGLTKHYGSRVAVDRISLHVEAGACVGLLGPNGAGKTTTIRMLSCLAAPTAGSLRVLGMEMVPANHRAIKAGLGIVQQEDSLDPDLSVENNLLIYASYFGIPRHEAAKRAQELMRFAQLTERRRDRIRDLSGGMRRRLMLARALINGPRLLLLDEPTTGLDPQARRLVWERIRRLKQHSVTILLTTHYMEEAANLCDRVVIVDHGKIVAEGPPQTLVDSVIGEEVIEVYLPDSSASRGVLEKCGEFACRTEQAGEILYLYLRNGSAGQRAFEALAGYRFTRRKPSLEDVFLSLTGHALRD